MFNPVNWANDCAMQPTFWQSWLGIISLLVIGLCSLYAIAAPRGKDKLHDRLFYWLLFITCGAALMHAFYRTDPHGIMRTFIVLIALRFLFTTIERFFANRRGHTPPRKDC